MALADLYGSIKNDNRKSLFPVRKEKNLPSLEAIFKTLEAIFKI